MPASSLDGYSLTSLTITADIKLLLYQVGREMVTSTDDVILRQDMPSALTKVESAAKLLEEAAKMSMVKSRFGWQLGFQ